MWRDTLHLYGNALTARNEAVPAAILGGSMRFDVYRNNVECTLMNALAETYPVVLKLTGKDFFDAMARAYAEKTRPASPVLQEYGASFSDFIETFEPAAGLPFLPDVARFEWIWLQAYHAPDRAHLHISMLSGIPEPQLDDLLIGLHPSLHLFQSRHPAVSIWRAHHDEEFPDLSMIGDKPEHAVVIRPALDVHVHDISATAHRFYTGLSEGATLAAVCDAVADAPDFDPSRGLAELFAMGGVVALNQSVNRGEQS